MLRYEEALQRVLQNSVAPSSQSLPLDETLHLFLSEDLYASRAQPPWDNSAMDGYAIAHSDLDSTTTFQIIEEIAAGARPQNPIVTGTCARIFTGAPMPVGADTVIIQENTERENSIMTILQKPRLGANVRKKGEEYTQGSLIATKGSCVTIGLLGLAAALGCATLPVYRRPRIAILSTGDELVPLGSQPDLHP